MLNIVEVDRLSPTPFKYLGILGYSLKLKNGDTLWDNFTFLKNLLHLVVDDFEVKMMETEARIFSWIFKEEYSLRIQKSRIFIVNDFNAKICISRIKKFVEENLAENKKSEPGSRLWNIEDARSYFAEKFEICSEEMLKFVSSRKDIENLKFLCDLAQKTVRFAQEMMSKQGFSGVNNNEKDNPIYLRLLCESKKEDRKEWHFFNEDVINALEYVVLSDDENDKKHEKLEKWRKNGSIITVKCFETMLDLLNISKSRFIIVQDFEITKGITELPLIMGYCAMKVVSPDGKDVYHQIQAQFLLFQFAVCDIYWPKRKSEEHEKQKTKIIEEMRNITKGYHLASEIDEIIEKFKYSKLAEKTGLASIHGIMTFKTTCSPKLVRIFLKSIGMSKSKEIRFFKPMNFAVFLKYTLMMMNIQRFFDRQEDLDLKKNIMKAWSLGLANIDDFEMEYWMNNPFSMEFYDCKKVGKCYQQMVRNRTEGLNYHSDGLIRSHYHFKLDDHYRKKMQTDGKSTDRTAIKTRKLLDRFLKKLPKVLLEMPEDVFESIDDFLKRFIDVFRETWVILPAFQLINASQLIRPFLREETKDFLDFAKIDEKWFCKKKKSAEKIEESPRKYQKEQREIVIETKIVETCQKCSEIEKENIAFARKIEELERNRTSMKKTIDEKEGDLQILNLQIKQNKLNYEEAVENHQKYVENREMKILQYEYEIEQYLDDWKNEKMKLLDENRKSRRNENEEIEKMKKRLENAKFSDRNMNRIIEKLQNENNQLKVRIEIARENL